MDGLLLFGFVSLALLGVGHAALRAVGLRAGDDAVCWPGWCAAAGGFVVGLGLAVLWWAWPGSFGVASAVGVPVALGAGLALAASARSHSPLPPPPPAERDRVGLGIFAVALAGALALVASQLLEVQAVPALRGDEGYLFGLQAQAIRVAEGLGEEYGALAARPLFRHPDYPLGVPVLRAWVHALYGEQALFAERWPGQLLALGLVCALAGALLRAAGPRLATALLLAWLAADGGEFVLVRAQGEVPVALGMLLAADGFARARAGGGSAWSGLAALGLSLALFSKNEARLWTLALVVALMLSSIAEGVRERPARVDGPDPGRGFWRRPLLALPLGVLVLCIGFNAAHGFENDLLTAKGEGVGLWARLVDLGPGRLLDVVGYFAGTLLVRGGTGGWILLLLVPLVLADPVRRSAAPHGATALAVWVGLAGLFAVYLTTPQELDWHLDTSARRVAWQLLPSAALALGALLGPGAGARVRAGAAPG